MAFGSRSRPAGEDANWLVNRPIRILVPFRHQPLGPFKCGLTKCLEARILSLRVKAASLFDQRESLLSRRVEWCISCFRRPLRADGGGTEVLVITGVTAITMDNRRRVIGDAVITVEGKRITAVSKGETPASRFPGAEVIDGQGMVALPGLIDTHAHADQSILRGTTDDLGWIPFLADWIGPYLRRRSPADTVAAYRLSALEMVKSGTTCFVSPNFDPNDDVEALEAALDGIGLRPTGSPRRASL